jgi:hypothetical protein
MITTTGSQAACDHPSSTRHPVIPQHLEIGAHVVKEHDKIATAEEAESLPSERSHARESNKSRIHIANALHRVGLTTILISITDNINDFIVDSRHLAKHQWLSSFDRLAPYSLWVGVLFVFAGIVVRDRGWRRRSSGLE